MAANFPLFGTKPPARSFVHARLTFSRISLALAVQRYGLGFAVVFVNVLADGLLQLGDAMKDATPDALHRQIAKEAFDHVQPGRTGRDAVHVKALVAGQPQALSRALRPYQFFLAE